MSSFKLVECALTSFHGVSYTEILILEILKFSIFFNFNLNYDIYFFIFDGNNISLFSSILYVCPRF